MSSAISHALTLVSDLKLRKKICIPTAAIALQKPEGLECSAHLNGGHRKNSIWPPAHHRTLPRAAAIARALKRIKTFAFRSGHIKFIKIPETKTIGQPFARAAVTTQENVEPSSTVDRRPTTTKASTAPRRAVPCACMGPGRKRKSVEHLQEPDDDDDENGNGRNSIKRIRTIAEMAHNELVKILLPNTLHDLTTLRRRARWRGGEAASKWLLEHKPHTEAGPVAFLLRVGRPSHNNGNFLEIEKIPVEDGRRRVGRSLGLMLREST